MVTLPENHEKIVKKWHDGKTTYAAAASTFAVAITGMLGYDLNSSMPVEVARFGDLIEYLLIAGFALMAAYGRAKAISAGFIGKKRIQNEQ